MSNWSMARRAAGALCTLSVIALTLACSLKKGTNNGTDGDVGDLPGAITLNVNALTGATLTTAGGVQAIIGPGALPNDTAMSLIPVRPPSLDGTAIAAARLEPDGLILDSAVVVRFPLPANWPASVNPIVLEFKGSDPLTAVPSMAYARVTGVSGNLYAEVLVSHFSGVVCAANCHAGTIKQVLSILESRGCSRDSVMAAVRRRFPAVDVPDDGCGFRGVETIQAFLDTYFEDIGGYNDGQDVPANVLSQMLTYANEGRQVIFAFKPGRWGNRGGTNNFLPTSALEFSHTAVLERHDGEFALRNSLATGDTALIRALGGTNTVWYPASQLNQFRRLPQGVATELQICGQPDCLSDPSRNEYGIAPYQPIAGQSYVGRAWSDPWTYMMSSGRWSGIPPRGIPWTAVRIYVERLDGPQNDLCGGGFGGNTFVGAVNIPGRTGAFVPLSVRAALGTYDNQPGYPGIEATTDPSPDQLSLLYYDFAILFLSKDLIGSSTYPFSNGAPGFKALFVFSTPNIEDEDTGYPTTFSSASGTLTLNEYGASVGARLKGTFDVALIASQSVFRNGEWTYQPLTGSISGSFDAVIADYGAMSPGGLKISSVSFGSR